MSCRACKLPLSIAPHSVNAYACTNTVSPVSRQCSHIITTHIQANTMHHAMYHAKHHCKSFKSIHWLTPSSPQPRVLLYWISGEAHDWFWTGGTRQRACDTKDCALDVAQLPRRVVNYLWRILTSCIKIPPPTAHEPHTVHWLSHLHVHSMWRQSRGLDHWQSKRQIK